MPELMYGRGGASGSDNNARLDSWNGPP
jgi:hypothetical protein